MANLKKQGVMILSLVFLISMIFSVSAETIFYDDFESGLESYWNADYWGEPDTENLSEDYFVDPAYNGHSCDFDSGCGENFLWEKDSIVVYTEIETEDYKNIELSYYNGFYNISLGDLQVFWKEGDYCDISDEECEWNKIDTSTTPPWGKFETTLPSTAEDTIIQIAFWVNGSNHALIDSINISGDEIINLPTCSVDYLKEVYNGNNEYYFSDSKYVNETGTFEVYGSASPNDENGQLNLVQYNRTSPDPYFVPSWKTSNKQDSWKEWKTDVNDNDFIQGEHTVCCRAISEICQEGNCAEEIIGNPNCQEFCLDTTPPSSVSDLKHSDDDLCDHDNVDENIIDNDDSLYFSWDEATDEPDCSGIEKYVVELYNASDDELLSTHNPSSTYTTFSLTSIINGGKYYVIVKAVDKAGNIGPETKSKDVLVDMEKPEVVLFPETFDNSEVTPGNWYKDDFNLGFQSNDSLTGMCKCDLKIYDDGSKTEDIEMPCYCNMNWNSNINIEVGPEGDCTTIGKNTCEVQLTVEDKAGNTNSISESFSIDYEKPNTIKVVGAPKILHDDMWSWNGFNGLLHYFITDKTTIDFSCDDGKGIGAQKIYYNIYDHVEGTNNFNLTHELSENRSSASFSCHDDGLFKIKYWCVDELENTEDKNTEIDKVDIITPETTKEYIVNSENEFWGKRYLDMFDMNIMMHFLKFKDFKINLTTYDDEVGVEETLWTLYVPDENGDHVEAYLNGSWVEQNSQELEDCMIEKECYSGTESYEINESEFSEDNFGVDVSIEKYEGVIRWEFDFDGEDMPSHTSTGAQVIITNETKPLFTLGWSPGENTEAPTYKEYNSGWGSATTELPEGMYVSGDYNEESYTIEIDENLLECPWKWAINVEATDPETFGHSSSEQQNYPSDWNRLTATNTASGVECYEFNYNDCSECNITHWKNKRSYMQNECMNEDISVQCETQCYPQEDVWCPYVEPINLTQQCDHKICYKSVDRLGNVEEEHCQVFSADGQGPVIDIHNPTPNLASNMDNCSQSIVTTINDIKSGVNESSVYAYLVNSSNKTVKKTKLRKTGYGTFDGYMTLHYPEGDYELKICAEDNVGNENCEIMPMSLKETLKVQYILPAQCRINPETGGECNFTYHVCMRGGNSVQFWMNKLGGPSGPSPGEMNATISYEGEEKFVGLEEDHITKDGGILQIGEDCKDINGRAEFDFHLELTPEHAADLGGVTKLDYKIESSLQPDQCNQED